MTTTRIISISTFPVAAISIALYGSLAFVCFYYALKFWNREKRAVSTGRYAMPKFVFFVVLGCAALLDLPTFFACVVKLGPPSCAWNDTSYAFCWCCHLIATCGQQFAVITPSILWSDIIQQKDGNFWNSASPLDSVKIFFRIIFVVNCAAIFVTVVGVIAYSKASDETSFTKSNSIGVMSNCLIPFTLFFTAFGCLYCGIRLQRHVVNVQLGTATQRKFLVQLNFLMILITISYGIRAVLVLTLFDYMPQSFKSFSGPVAYYPFWLPLTQWLPYVFCSFCLVANMRFKGGGTTNRKSDESDYKDSGIKLATVHSFIESALDGQHHDNDDQEGQDLSMTERGTDVSFDQHGQLSRITDLSVEGRPDRSISFLLHSQQQQHHNGDVNNPLSAHLVTIDDRPSDQQRDSDRYSTFGGGCGETGFDAYRDSRLSSVSGVGGVDAFFSASALQRSVSPHSSVDSSKPSASSSLVDKV